MDEPLTNYKEKVSDTLNMRLTWERELIFSSSTQRGYDLDFDPYSEWGCQPLESLVMSLAGCLAIDIVAILGRMRCAPETFRMDIQAKRRTEPPQRLVGVELVLYLSGPVNEKKLQRAISLSEEKYCSVRHSLREDIEITTRYVLE